MKTFAEFITEAKLEEKDHYMSMYREWGLIHPKTGRVISGNASKDHNDHKTLKNHLRHYTKLGKDAEHAAEYAHVPGGFNDNSGALMIRNVTKHNKAAVLKSYDKLPHAASKQVFVNDVKGHRLAMYNHIRNTEFGSEAPAPVQR